jgi:hypothetical protein
MNPQTWNQFVLSSDFISAISQESHTEAQKTFLNVTVTITDCHKITLAKGTCLTGMIAMLYPNATVGFT